MISWTQSWPSVLNKKIHGVFLSSSHVLAFPVSMSFCLLLVLGPAVASAEPRAEERPAGEAPGIGKEIRTRVSQQPPVTDTSSSATDDEAERREIYRLREENRRVNDFFDVTTYQLYRSNPTRVRGSLGTTGSVLQSEGGAEAAYRVPYIGFVDERVLQVYARLLWSNTNDMLLNEDSLQGGAGIRYKPLKEQNLYLSFERLFAIGRDADNTFLLRAQYGIQDGADIKPGEAYYNYSLFYADLAYVTSETTNLPFYGEARQGITFNLGDFFLISPHVVIDGHTQSHNTNNLSYFEGGPGISLRLLFNETKYEAYRSSVQFLVQYRANLINANNGLVVTGELRF